MSMRTYINYGYGICTDDLEKYVNKNTFLALINEAPKYKEYFSDFIKELEEDNGKTPFIETEYYTDICDIDYSIAEILKEVILENEHVYFIACSDFDDNHYLIFQPYYPWDATTEEERGLTHEKIQEIIAKYTKIICPNLNPVCDYCEVENCG